MKRFLTSPKARLAAELVLIFALLALAFSGGIVARATPAQAATAPMANYWYQCNALNHVAVFTDRVHIFCQTTTNVGGAPVLDPAIVWFAIPTSPDSATASRFMSLLQTSVITGRLIWLQLDPSDTSGSSYGCGAANCRKFIGVEMR